MQTDIRKNKMSGALEFSSEWLTEFYDKLLQDTGFSNGLKKQLRQHKKEIEEIYRKIEGKWWKTGTFWQKLYHLENWYGKASYEIGKELKALDIVVADLDAIRKDLKE